MKPGEDEFAALQRTLTQKLSPPRVSSTWSVHSCVAEWTRPNFDGPLYPYAPPHVTRPKEQRRVFLIALPETAVFAVPRQLKLFAVPLFELFDHVDKYGPIVASVPIAMSRFHLLLLGSAREESETQKDDKEDKEDRQHKVREAEVTERD